MKKTILQVSFISPTGTVISRIDKTDTEYTKEEFLEWFEKVKQEEMRLHNVADVAVLSLNLIKFGYV